jgi:PAS domain S-box-containing protein
MGRVRIRRWRRGILRSVVAVLLVIASASAYFLFWTKASTRVPLTDTERAWLSAHPVIRIAPDPVFPPIEYIDAAGVHRGFTADVFALIAERLDVRFTVVPLPSWETVLQKARDGEIDVITAAQETPERLGYLLFTSPILDIPNVIIARADVQGTLDLAEMQGKRVAVTRGYALQEYIAAGFPGIVLVPTVNDLAALEAVAFRHVDAAVVNIAVAAHLIGTHGISNLRVAGDSRRSNSLSIAVRRDLPVLHRIMEKGLATVEDEERADLLRRWMGSSLDGTFHTAEMMRLVLAASLALLALIVIVLLWNRSLRRRVAQRTAELHHELTERRRVESALRASEELFRSAAHGLRDGLVIIDFDGHALFANPAALRLAALAHGTPMRGLNVMAFIHEDSRATAASDLAKMREGALGLLGEYRLVTADGTERWVEGHGAPIVFEGTRADLVSLRDITDRKRVDADLRKSLREKEMLVREIHHRVKNNMQVISSLLNMQAALAADPSVRSIYRESQSRIRSMAVVHEKLFRAGAMTELDFGDYVHSMVAELIRSFGHGQIRCAVNVVPLPLTIDQAIPAGLILNELVTNAFKHGFPNDAAGTITVTLRAAAPGRAELIVEDDGVGFPIERGFDSSVTLGFTLLTSLTKQVGGTVHRLPGTGTRIAVRFPFDGAVTAGDAAQSSAEDPR